MKEADAATILQALIAGSREAVGPPPIEETVDSLLVIIGSAHKLLARLVKEGRDLPKHERALIAKEIFTTACSYYGTLQYWLSLNMHETDAVKAMSRLKTDVRWN